MKALLLRDFSRSDLSSLRDLRLPDSVSSQQVLSSSVYNIRMMQDDDEFSESYRDTVVSNQDFEVAQALFGLFDLETSWLQGNLRLLNRVDHLIRKPMTDFYLSRELFRSGTLSNARLDVFVQEVKPTVLPFSMLLEMDLDPRTGRPLAPYFSLSYLYATGAILCGVAGVQKIPSSVPGKGFTTVPCLLFHLIRYDNICAAIDLVDRLNHQSCCCISTMLRGVFSSVANQDGSLPLWMAYDSEQL